MTKSDLVVGALPWGSDTVHTYARLQSRYAAMSAGSSKAVRDCMWQPKTRGGVASKTAEASCGQCVR